MPGGMKYCMKQLSEGNETKSKREWNCCHVEWKFNWNKCQEECHIAWNSCQGGMRQNPRENEIAAMEKWKFDWSECQKEWNIAWKSCHGGMKQRMKQFPLRNVVIIEMWVNKNETLNETSAIAEWNHIPSRRKVKWDKNEVFARWNEAVSVTTWNETGAMNEWKFISFHLW